MKKPKSEKQLQAQCDAFNQRFRVGTAVVVAKDGGENVSTTTRSEAWVMSGHSAVIQIAGISGSYLLDRVAADARRPNGNH